MKTPELETERLRLVPVSLRHAPFLMALMGDPEVRRYLGGPVPWRRRLSTAWTFARATARQPVWIVSMKGKKRPIAVVSLTLHKDGKDIELSYQMHPAAWGLGYGAEAAARVLAYARDDMALPRIIAETQSANAASRRLLEKLGMTRIETLTRFGAEQSLYATERAL